MNKKLGVRLEVYLLALLLINTLFCCLQVITMVGIMLSTLTRVVMEGYDIIALSTLP